MNKNIFYSFAVLLSCLSLITNAHAERDTRHTVNILTWWGYLNQPELIKKAEAQCKVKISIDEYYSNDEFLRRWHSENNSYDVIIFSDIAYNFIKDEIPKLRDSNLYKQSSLYNSTIEKHYLEKKYPHNVVYFFQALTGFLWNSQAINLSSKDTIFSIFQKSKNKYSVLIDESIEAWMLMRVGFEKNGIHLKYSDFSEENFSRMTQDSKIYISNTYNQIYDNADFAFSFNWSGGLILDMIRSNKNYKFLIHPSLSYVTSDLLAQITNRNESACISEYLTNKETSNYIQEREFYFSPYTEYTDIKDLRFKKIYKDYLSLLSKLTWKDSVRESEFEQLNRSWQIIKISVNNHRK